MAPQRQMRYALDDEEAGLVGGRFNASSRMAENIPEGRSWGWVREDADGGGKEVELQEGLFFPASVGERAEEGPKYF